MKLWWGRTRRRTRIRARVPRSGLSVVVLLLLAAPLGGGPAPVPEDFVDATPGSGIDFRHVAFQTPKKYLPETMGSGVALFDYDNDGRLDIFLVNGAPLSDPLHKARFREDRAEVLESALSPEERRNIRRRDGEGWIARHGLRNGRCGG